MHNSVRKSKPLDIYVCAEHISKYVSTTVPWAEGRKWSSEFVTLLQFMWHWARLYNIQASLFLQHTGIVSSLQTHTTKSVSRLTTMLELLLHIYWCFIATYTLMYEKMGNFHICTQYYIISCSSKQLWRAHRTAGNSQTNIHSPTISTIYSMYASVR